MKLAWTLRTQLCCVVIVTAVFSLAFIPLCLWMGPTVAALGVLPVGAVAVLFGGRLRAHEAERRRAGVALGASEQRLRALTQSAADGIAIVDAVGTTRYQSPAVAAIVGFAPDELLGLDIFARIHPDDLATAQRLFAELAAEPRGIRESELRVRHADETWRLLAIRGTNLIGEPGIDGIVLNYRDITAHRRTEAALRQSANEFRTLVEQLPATIYRAPTDASGATLFISPQALAMLGYDPACWLADPDFWPDRVHPDDRSQVLAAFATGRATGQPVVAEYRFRARDGREVWLRDEAIPVCDEGGQPLYWQGVMLDITERRHAEMLLTAQAVILERIAEDAPLAETLNLLAVAVEAVGDGALVSIQLLNDDGATLGSVAAPSLPPEYMAVTAAIPIGEGVAACGTSAFRRAPVVAADIATDPLWGDYRDLARGFGLAAC